MAKTCPSCGKPFKRRVKTGGGVISCTHCGNPVRLTAEERAAVARRHAGPPPAGEEGDAPPGDQTHDTEAEDRRESEQHQEKQKPPAGAPKGHTEIGEREQEEGEADTEGQQHEDHNQERHAGPVW